MPSFRPAQQGKNYYLQLFNHVGCVIARGAAQASAYQFRLHYNLPTRLSLGDLVACFRRNGPLDRGGGRQGKTIKAMFLAIYQVSHRVAQMACMFSQLAAP
ncbi:hypothetical protein [Mesorhizobium caraganae]|uniref:hypothetical protein n=1 Tax=Mesorhizobium caraganae TaxID=483206 RepID=UPI0017828639|nr:hypothetical protein [Mesorhizobium caraganae]